MIIFCPYQVLPARFNPWQEVYLDVANALITELNDPSFEFLHFGSSSFKAAGKGIIDIAILYSLGELDAAVSHLKSFGFVDQHSDNPFPAVRPRKDCGVRFKGEHFNVHAHVIEKNCEERVRQVAYKNHMLNNPIDRAAYERKKQAILAKGITQQDEYGKAKSPFVKSVLVKL